MNTPIPENKLISIKEALFGGRKIEAIKLYREVTGTGLAEAKPAVEKIEAELRASSPDKFTAAPAGKGCFGMVILACAVVGVVAWWLA